VYIPCTAELPFVRFWRIVRRVFSITYVFSIELSSSSPRLHHAKVFIINKLRRLRGGDELEYYHLVTLWKATTREQQLYDARQEIANSGIAGALT